MALPQKHLSELQKVKSVIVRILKENGIRRAGIFGSFARGEQTEKSDIDIIIEPRKRMGLEFVGLAFDLEKELGKKVDLVTYKSLHPLLKKSILKDEVRILDEKNAPQISITPKIPNTLQGVVSCAVPLMKKQGVVKAGIFGSYARGEQKKGSDVDILVQLKKGDGYFELVGLELELKKALNLEVDLIPYDGLNPLLKKTILQNEVRII